ncbi:MAG: EamA family transporter, partial [Chlamydiia bacterium]
IALNSLMSQVLGWYLITKGLNKLNLSISGLLLLTQPGLTFIFDCLFAHRNTAWYQVAGCMLLLWVVYVTLMNDKKGELICE